MMDWLSGRAIATPRKTALIFENRIWDFSALDQETDQMVDLLVRAGVESGNHIGVLMANSPEYVFLIHAIARLGCVLVPLNIRLTLEEIVWQVDQSDCNMVIFSRDNEEKAALLFTNCSQLKRGDLTNSQLSESIDQGIRQVFSLDGLRSLPPKKFDRSCVVGNLGNLQAIVFTSGTTGYPKGVMLTFGNHFWSATASSFRLGLLPDDRWLLCMPLYHVGGMAIVFRAVLYGICIILHPDFNTERVNSSIDNQMTTIVSLVPTMLSRILQIRDGQVFPETLRCILLGGAAASRMLLNHCIEHKIPIALTYGLTEAASQVATSSTEIGGNKLGSVGHPLMFTNVKICDENGKTVPVGDLGEIWVKGPIVMVGYYKNELATTQAIVDGWLRTGDFGRFDLDGDLWIELRRTDLIVSGGENVYPLEVENVIRSYPGVSDVCVVGVGDEEWGQKICAAIVIQNDLSIEGLTSFCNSKLARYKIPKRVIVVDEIPKTASGKIKRFEVQKMFVN